MGVLVYIKTGFGKEFLEINAASIPERVYFLWKENKKEQNA